MAHQPSLLATLVARVPRGLWQILHRGGRDDAPGGGLLARLRRLELLGLLYGPLCYLRSVRVQRQAGIGAKS